MTDKEIIKALECCISTDNINPKCESCPYDGDDLLRPCNHNLMKDAIDLINRQQADNERLKKLLEEADVNYNKCAKRFYKEGVKELAKGLKKAKQYSLERHENIVSVAVIDWIVKEMVGDVE